MRRRRREANSNDTSQEWLLTYADMVTLVLTFFVLLYSFSVLDVVKFKQFITSFQGSGILDWGPVPMEQPQPESSSQQQPSEQAPSSSQSQMMQQISETNPLLEVFYTVQTFLQESGLEQMVEVRYEDRGIALDIKERVLFDSGKADLKPEARKLLDSLAGLLDKLPYQISVEGHTDNRPINTPEFPTNWELSTRRSVRVVRYFTETLGLDPKKFAATGYSEFQPVAPNDTPEKQALNRRVVIMIIARDPYGNEVLQK
ncbi:hypothetical protein SY88_04065 [Clostridiales bacterium PH28_bin88]|nr:hypothetical protein SY88_04065 [Clostridiales bacterium PH28_bin88]